MTAPDGVIMPEPPVETTARLGEMMAEAGLTPPGTTPVVT